MHQARPGGALRRARAACIVTRGQPLHTARPTALPQCRRCRRHSLVSRFQKGVPSLRSASEAQRSAAGGLAGGRQPSRHAGSAKLAQRGHEAGLRTILAGLAVPQPASALPTLHSALSCLALTVEEAHCHARAVLHRVAQLLHVLGVCVGALQEAAAGRRGRGRDKGQADQTASAPPRPGSCACTAHGVNEDKVQNSAAVRMQCRAAEHSRPAQLTDIACAAADQLWPMTSSGEYPVVS